MATSAASLSDGPVNLLFRQAIASSVDDATTDSSDSVLSLPIDLIIAHDPSADTACFRLRVYLNLRSSPSGQQKKESVNLLLEPEHISSITYEELDVLPDNVSFKMKTRGAKKWSGRINCLKFALAPPSSIIVPHQDIMPSGALHARTWKNLRSLSQHHELCVYFTADSQAMPQLSKIREAASHGRLKSSPKHFDIVTLYNGRGGMIFEPDGKQPVASSSRPAGFSAPAPAHAHAPPDDLDASTESPPSYDELGPGPPSPPRLSSRKRARTSSSGADGQEHHSQAPWAEFYKQAAEMEVRLEKVIKEAAESEARLRKRLEDVEAANERLSERLQEGSTAANEQLKVEMMEYADDRLEQVRGEIEDLVDVRIDDCKTDIRCDVQDEIDEKFEQAQEDIKEKLQSWGASLAF